jgi:hypothetical protein
MWTMGCPRRRWRCRPVLMPLDWIIEYEEANHQTLFAMGKADAMRALANR